MDMLYKIDRSIKQDYPPKLPGIAIFVFASSIVNAIFSIWLSGGHGFKRRIGIIVLVLCLVIAFQRVSQKYRGSAAPKQ